MHKQCKSKVFQLKRDALGRKVFCIQDLKWNDAEQRSDCYVIINDLVKSRNRTHLCIHDQQLTQLTILTVKRIYFRFKTVMSILPTIKRVISYWGDNAFYLVGLLESEIPCKNSVAFFKDNS